jgi:hypothetical protein
MTAAFYRHQRAKAKWRAHQVSRQTEAIAPSPDAVAARSDLGLLGAYVAGKVPAPHHRRWLPYLRTGESNDCLRYYAGQNIDLLAPRGSAKSMWVAIAAADIIGHNPHVQILYLSHSRDIALKQSRIIKRLIESPLYQEVFPHIRPGNRWADTDWEIDKVHAGVSVFDSDATLKAYGVLGSVIGGRFHIILGDDLIKSSKAISNPAVREDMAVTLSEVIEPCIIPGGRFIDVGTRFRRDDIHCTEFTQENGWQTVETSAIEVDSSGIEHSYWESRYKLERLQDLRRRKPNIFTYQFQNKLPPSDEDTIIKPEWVRWGTPPDRFFKLVVGCDLAASEKQSNDMSAFVVCGLRRRPYEVWVLDCYYGRIVGNVDKLLLLKKIRDTYGTYELVPETNGYQRSLMGDWRTIFQNQWGIRDIGAVPTPSKGDKDERLNGISGVFANGFVFFSRNAPTGSHEDKLYAPGTEATVKYNTGLGLLISQLTGQAEPGEDDLSDACEKAIARLQGKNRKIWGA